jgi:hypothetical protein
MTGFKSKRDMAQWDKPSVSFNEWWDSDFDHSANPFEEYSAAYWAWAGWQAAQRPWVGLTDDEIDVIYLEHHNQYNECESLDWGYERAIEQALKKKNT